MPKEGFELVTALSVVNYFSFRSNCIILEPIKRSLRYKLGYFYQS